jgi:hypothetical protein
MQMTKSKWFLPGFALAMGIVIFAAQWAGGDASGGVISLAILAGFGALVLFGGRSETIRGLRGDGRDERLLDMDIKATAISGMAIITAIIAAFIVQLARGEDVMPYAWLGAVGGLAYIVAIVVLRVRR